MEGGREKKKGGKEVIMITQSVLGESEERNRKFIELLRP